MYLITLTDKTVLATATWPKVLWIKATYKVSSYWYCDSRFDALEIADLVIV